MQGTEVWKLRPPGGQFWGGISFGRGYFHPLTRANPRSPHKSGHGSGSLWRGPCTSHRSLALHPPPSHHPHCHGFGWGGCHRPLNAGGAGSQLWATLDPQTCPEPDPSLSLS